MKKTSPAKEYLRKIRAEQKELRLLLQQRDELRLSLLPQAIRYDRSNIQAMPQDTLPGRVADVCKLDDAIVDHIKDLDIHKAQAVGMIRQIESPACRTVLMLYYIGDGRRLLRWQDVAKIMGYSLENVHKIHGRALGKFSKILSKNA